MGKKGKPLSAKHKAAISKAQTGKAGHWAGKALSAEHRRHISEGGKGKTYTPQAIESFRKRRASEDTCKKISQAQRGEKSAAWKGGRSSQAAIDRGRTRAWRRRVLRRDGHRCRKCGASDYLEAHHIKGFREFPELRFDVDNGITHCRACHKEEERLKREARKAQLKIKFGA